MIKKFGVILSIGILCFNSMKIDSYADEVYKRNLIQGNTRQISMELNKSVFKKADEVFFINEESLVDGISVTPLAYAKNAPIIPVKFDELDSETMDYLKQLGVKKINIIGSIESISQNIEVILELEEYEIDRIYGEDRYETSIKIADELNKIKPVESIILINSKVGIENALGLYSYAAQKNMPIIWSNDSDFSLSKSYIKENKIKKVFTVGDLKDFNNKLKENVKDVEVVKEINRSNTNINVINKLQEGEFNSLYTINAEYGDSTNNNEYISLGVVAAKQNEPILICEESLTKTQEKFLEDDNITTLNQIGSEVSDYSIINAIMRGSFLSSAILILLLIIMFIRTFI